MIDVALLAFKELSRRRFFAGAVIATGILVALTGWGFAYIAHLHLGHGRPITRIEGLTISAVLTILIAYLFSFLLAMAAVFLAAPSFANDIESGVLLPVLARPLSRSAILCGRAFALAFVIAVYTLITGACEFAVVRAATGYMPPHPASALGFLALSGIVMTALALLLGTRMPAMGASILAVGLFIIARLGGIAQGLGSYYGNENVVHAGTISQLILPSDAMWQAALFRLEPASMAATFAASHTWPGPFFTAASPPAAMIFWSIAWIIAATVLAARSLELRDL